MKNDTGVKHTSGPWRTAEHDDCEIYADDGSFIGTVAQPENGPIVAAAPDMLGALEVAEATIVRLNRHDSANGTLDVIRAAIRKAKGEL